MKSCKTCTNCQTYHTGMDEYPPCTTISYCNKGHWENSVEELGEEDMKNCPDYEEANHA